MQIYSKQMWGSQHLTYAMVKLLSMFVIYVCQMFSISTENVGLLGFIQIDNK